LFLYASEYIVKQGETELLEFKFATKQYSFVKINIANSTQPSAWLSIFNIGSISHVHHPDYVQWNMYV